MKEKAIYKLNDYGVLGCLPECVIVETDKNNEFQIDSVKITSANKNNYEKLFDENDQILLQCCFQLEINKIISLISDKNINNIQDIFDIYFSNKRNPSTHIKNIKNYLIDYVNGIQNTFFERINDKPLYISQGQFSFEWNPISIEMDIPELFYCFDYQDESIIYSLDVNCRNKLLALDGGVLVSRNRARVLLQNKVYEFEESVDGAKLIPFFNRKNVLIQKKYVATYFDKIIRPLIKTNKVIAKGFNINMITELSNVVLHISELGGMVQMSLFEPDDVEESYSPSILFELIFEYGNLTFWAGQQGTTSTVKPIQDTYTIDYVQRDITIENQFLSILKQVGMDLDGKLKKMPHFEGIEWLNENYKTIESAGIDIQFKRKSDENIRYFMGERDIKIEIKENNDWFDIYGTIRFGDYEISFLQVLNYIRHNKKMILLPNGEYAQIPQSWIDEYLSFVQFASIENGKATIHKHYAVLIDNLSRKPDFSVKMRENLQHFVDYSNTLNYDMPINFKGNLRSYQIQGYNWLRLLDELNMGGCLADDMGLGKTIQTLCLLQWLKEQNRKGVLLVVPTSLVYNWQNEARKFTPDLSVCVHVGNKRTTNFNDLLESDVVITSYAILRRDKQMLSSLVFDYVILDESQAIKNSRAAITQICLSIKATHFLTLTGTPIENSLSDLWSQMHFINRNMLGSENSFTKNCESSEKRELYKQLLRPFLLRRNKETVLTDLPEKTIIVQSCEMTDEQLQQYRDIRNSYRDKFLDSKNGNNKVDSFVLLEGLLRLRQVANHPVIADKEYDGNSGKFDTVVQMISDVINQGDKVLIFSSFVEHLKIYRRYLDEQEIHYCYLDGSTKDRQQQVELFQESDDYHIFLLSLKAGGTGLNLTRASYVFLLDPWWNPAAEAQAYDRAHRIGQKNSVFVYKFITQNTIEEKILKLQERKLSLSDAMLENDSSIIKHLDINEVMKLIE